jgi:hypothetical protein
MHVVSLSGRWKKAKTHEEGVQPQEQGAGVWETGQIRYALSFLLPLLAR